MVQRLICGCVLFGITGLYLGVFFMCLFDFVLDFLLDFEAV